MTKPKNTAKKLRRKQLDTLFASIQSFIRLIPPSKRWIQDIREALGISPAQFGKLLGISRQAFLKFEIGEKKQTLTLQSLERIAAAMHCKVIYALVPDPSYGSLEEVLKERAEQVARKYISKVSKTMALEDQAVERSEIDRQIKELADELVRNFDKRLWETT